MLVNFCKHLDCKQDQTCCLNKLSWVLKEAGVFVGPAALDYSFADSVSSSAVASRDARRGGSITKQSNLIIWGGVEGWQLCFNFCKWFKSTAR